MITSPPPIIQKSLTIPGARRLQAMAAILPLAAILALPAPLQASAVLLSSNPVLSGAGATWGNFGNNTGGLPAAFGFNEASTSYGGDAFDGAGIVSVNGTRYANPDGDVDVTGQTLTTDLTNLNALTLSLQYTAMGGSQTLRTLVTMTNPGVATISRTISYETNWGSDGGTVVRSTSSGDAAITAGDRWSVTSDGGDSDPVNLTVFASPGHLLPSSIGTTVFDAAGTEGLILNYSLTFAPGETRHLVFYHELFDTNIQATTAAALYNAPLTGERIAGLPSTGIANFAPVPEPGLTALSLLSALTLLRRSRANKPHRLT